MRLADKDKSPSNWSCTTLSWLCGLLRPLSRLFGEQYGMLSTARVRKLQRQSIRLRKRGALDESLQACKQAVELARKLFQNQNHAQVFGEAYAGSLRDLANAQLVLGHNEDGLQTIQQAASTYRQLRQAQPKNFADELASILLTEGIARRRVNLHEDLVAFYQEPVGLYRMLHKDNHSGFGNSLAMALNGLAIAYISRGSYSAALLVYQEIVAVCITLTNSPPELPQYLQYLSDMLGHFDRHKESLQAAREAEELCREWYLKRPDTGAPDLVDCLRCTAAALWLNGFYDDAVQAMEEAEALCRIPNKKQNSAPTTEQLADTLIQLSGYHGLFGRVELSLQPCEEAVTIYRELYLNNPERFSERFAHSLIRSGEILSCLNRHNEATQSLLEAVAMVRILRVEKDETYSHVLASTLYNLGKVFSVLHRHDEAMLAIEEAVKFYRGAKDSFASQLAMGLNDLRFTYSSLGKHYKAKAAAIEAGVTLCGVIDINPIQWSKLLIDIALQIESANSLRLIHLEALKRIGELRRMPHFDSQAGAVFLQLQAVLVADLWRKLAAATEEDPAVMDDTLPVLLSSLQSPDLKRWLAAKQNDTATGLALAQAEYEYFEAAAVHAQLLERLRGARGSGQGGFGMGTREMFTDQQEVAMQVNIDKASKRESDARSALRASEEAVAAVDPGFRIAYEVPSSTELHAMLAHLQETSTAKHKGKADTAALLCFLELPAHGEQVPRLVGVLLSSQSTRVRQIEFPGLRELAQKFEQYEPLGQRSSHTLRLLRDSTPQPSPSQSEQIPPQDFAVLLGELEQLWWAPLATALGEELLGLKVLHLCSHGIAHQLPFSQVSHLSLSGNVQLFQWPGLPYLRLAYDQGYINTATEIQSAPALWQVAHDCAWHDKVPLPMVAVEAHLLRQIIGEHAHSAQSIDRPEQIHSNAHALVVCSHGSEAKGVNSAVQLQGGNLTTGEVMRRKLGPRLALIPACYAADTADDHAHNALGVAAGFLLSGSRVVVGSIKAVPDTLMPWFSTLLTWYVVHEKLALHAAAVRARQDFGVGEFPDEYVCWIRVNLPQALACLHPQGEESRHWAESVPKDSLMVTASQWPWRAMDKDAMIPRRPVDIQTMQSAAQQVAAQAFVPLGPQTQQQMREMAAFLVVFGMG